MDVQVPRTVRDRRQLVFMIKSLLRILPNHWKRPVANQVHPFVVNLNIQTSLPTIQSRCGKLTHNV
jgi:hypothetical protein